MYFSLTNTDKALLEQIAAGDEHAFRQLFDRYREQLYWVACKLTKSGIIAGEIIQDVFIGLWISRTHLKDIEEPAAYIYKILLNRVNRYLTIKNRQRIIYDSLQLKDLKDNTTEEQVMDNENKRLISIAIDHLPPQQKKVYCMRRLHGLTTAEIARELNISPFTAKSYLRDADKFIRIYLRDIAFVISLFVIR